MPEDRCPYDVVGRIRQSGLTIYDSLDAHPDLYLTSEELDTILNDGMLGFDLDYALRTRSKVAKSEICELLGYPVPDSFRRTRPRFPGQDFDVYVQKSNNLQIWNEEVVPQRRYVIVRVDENQIVTRVKVIVGEALALLDTTGTLTTKYQAKSTEPVNSSALVSARDTDHVLRRMAEGDDAHQLLRVEELFDKLVSITGTEFENPGLDQERNRGAVVHQLVARALPGLTFHDSGRFPDAPGQLLEVKLQTSPTIDLGLVSPDSTDSVADMPSFRHCDVRYAVFYGEIRGATVHVQHVVLTTGEDFFTFFVRFEGQVVNEKIQIPLPDELFR